MTQFPRTLRSSVTFARRRMSWNMDQILPRQRPNSLYKIDDLVVLFERNLYGHPLAALLWEIICKEVQFEKDGRTYQQGECL